MQELPSNVDDDDDNSDTGIERLSPDKSSGRDDQMNSAHKSIGGSGQKPPVVQKKKTMGLGGTANRLSVIPSKKQAHSRENSANRARTLNKSHKDSHALGRSQHEADDGALAEKLELLKQQGRKEAKNSSQPTAPAATKGKLNLAEQFKLQAEIGDIDLSGKGLTDNHSVQICQLLKQYCKEDVENLDLGHNKFTDNGILNICKALSET